MQITIIAGFEVGDIDTYEIVPAVLEVAVDPEKERAVDDILLGHAIMGNFRYTAEPVLGRLQIAVGQYSDLDRIEEAHAGIASAGMRCGLIQRHRRLCRTGSCQGAAAAAGGDDREKGD